MGIRLYLWLYLKRSYLVSAFRTGSESRISKFPRESTAAMDQTLQSQDSRSLLEENRRLTEELAQCKVTIFQSYMCADWEQYSIKPVQPSNFVYHVYHRPIIIIIILSYRLPGDVDSK